MFNLNSPKNFD